MNEKNIHLYLSNVKKNKECREKYVGLIRKNKKGHKFKIINYIDANNADIMFLNTGTVARRQLRKCLNGNVKDNYQPCVEDIGWIGEGDHQSKSKKYEVWRGILRRCNPKAWIKLPTYKGCQVCEEWKCFQSFADWYDINYYQIGNDVMEIDKDILFKTQKKLYSPDTCVFVNHKINCIFTTRANDRGNFPIGVYKKKEKQQFTACCSYVDENNKVKHIKIGDFDTPEEAFYAYKEFKETYIKQVADEYKNKIPQKLYEAMYNYEVEITD